MATIDENILKAAKDIVVKFIECGRLSPSGCPETFQSIYRTLQNHCTLIANTLRRTPARVLKTYTPAGATRE